MDNNLRKLAENIYRISEEADTYLDAVEELEEFLSDNRIIILGVVPEPIPIQE
jgi:hypothetical protein